MSDIAKFVLDFLKLAPRYLVAVAIICGVLLFCGDALLDLVGVRKFAQDNRQWIGLVFIATTTLFCVDRAIEIKRVVGKRKAIAKRSEKRLKRLHSLTEDEKQILRYYFAKQTRSNSLRIDDGVVQGLVAAGIIYRSASVGDLLEGFAYNISDFAWDYLHEHLDLLKGTTNTYRTDADEQTGW